MTLYCDFIVFIIESFVHSEIAQFNFIVVSQKDGFHTNIFNGAVYYAIHIIKVEFNSQRLRYASIH